MGLYLRLLHWKSLLLLAIALILFKFTLFNPFGDITLNWVGTFYLCLSIISIAGAGFLLDELITPQKLNSYKLSETSRVKTIGYRLYFILNIVGVLIGFYLSNLIDRPGFAVLFILGSALLYLKAFSLRKYIIIRPLTSAILLGLSFTGLWLFDVFPAITPYNQHISAFLLDIILVYTTVIGSLILIRALILNQLYIDHNHKNGIKSLSLTLGRERTNNIIFALVTLLICGIIYFLFSFLYKNLVSLSFVLLLIILPLIIILYKVLSAKQNRDFQLILKIMDGVIVCSVLSIALYQFQYLIK